MTCSLLSLLVCRLHSSFELTLPVLNTQIPAPPPEPETESKAAEEVTAEVVVEPLASPTADSSTGSSKSKAATALPQLLQVCPSSGHPVRPPNDSYAALALDDTDPVMFATMGPLQATTLAIPPL